MRLASVFVAVAVASLHASSGFAASTTRTVGVTMPENKTPDAAVPSLRTGEGRRARQERKRALDGAREERLLGWLKSCFGKFGKTGAKPKPMSNKLYVYKMP